nr:UCMe protein [Hippolyte inermis]
MKFIYFITVDVILVLLLGHQCCGNPVIDRDILNEDNSIKDAFLKEYLSSSLLNPVPVESSPTLSLHLEPPVIDFQMPTRTSEDGSIEVVRTGNLDTDFTHGNVVAPPSRILEPPVIEFEIIQMKGVPHSSFSSIFSAEEISNTEGIGSLAASAHIEN